MRINDWRSDVCSSDLLLTEPGSSASPDGSWYLLAPSRKHDTSPQWSAVSTRLPVPKDRHRTVRPASFPEPKSQAEYILKLSGWRGWPATGPWPPSRTRRSSPSAPRLAAAGRSAGRSEEHTSELQSLMRISYAVFCLKKKTSL